MESCSFYKSLILFNRQLIPIHCGAEKILFNIRFQSAVAQCCQQVSARLKPFADAGDDIFLTLSWKVKESIECDDSVENCRRKFRLRYVSTDEIASGTFALAVLSALGKVNSNYFMLRG